MSHMLALVVFSRVIVKLMRWLDANFEDILRQMGELYPDEPVIVLANRITDAAFSGAFV